MVPPMPRPLKPQKVKEARTAGGSCDVFLDRDALDFFADYEGTHVRAATADECVRLAQKAIDDWKPPAWVRLMDVGSSRRSSGNDSGCGHRAEVSVSFERAEFADLPKSDPDGRWDDGARRLRRPFVEDCSDHSFDKLTPDEARAKDQKSRTKRESASYSKDWVAYDEVAWATLLAVKATIERAGEVLDRVCNKDPALLRSFQAGAPAVLALPQEAPAPSRRRRRAAT